MFILRQILNWFKLFVALDFMITACIMLIIERSEFDNGSDRWGPLLAAMGIMFLIGLILLIWFVRILKKHRREKALQSPQQHPGPESSFYHNNPKFCTFMDGWSFNGFGSKFMTYSNQSQDRSLLATKWIMLGFFPAFPMYRQRIRIVSEKEKMNIPGVISTSRLTYEPFERVPLNRALIRYTYVFYFLFFLPAIVLPIVCCLIFLNELNTLLPGNSLWWIILIYLAWGVFLFFLADVFNKWLFLKRIY